MAKRIQYVRRSVLRQRKEIDDALLFKLLQNDRLEAYGMYIHMMPLVRKVDYFTLKSIDTL